MPDEKPSYVSEGGDKKYVVEFYPTFTLVHREGDPLPVAIENDILRAVVSAMQQYTADRQPTETPGA